MKDSSGTPVAKAESSEALLAAFLETDLQGDPGMCREVLTFLKQAKKKYKKGGGAERQLSFSGNGHVLEARKNEIIISSQYDDTLSPYHLKRKKLKKIVKRWLKFIETGE